MHFNTQKITVRIQKDVLTLQQKEQMWSLYQKSYKVKITKFYEDILKYNHYAFFYENGQIKGFVGIQLDHTKIHKQAYLLIQFGQAILQEKIRGKSLVPIAALKLLTMYWREILSSKIIFWGNTLTYKAYLLFAKTTPTFYPSKQHGIPYQMREVRDFIGTQYFKDSYDKATGRIRAVTHIVEDVSSLLCYKYEADSDIHFFTQQNPLHQEGEGLITLAPATKANIWSLIKRYIRFKCHLEKENDSALNFTTGKIENKKRLLTLIPL